MADRDGSRWRVATESGASKVTIFKHWPSKGALALEGYFTAVESVLEFTDTGDLGRDLRKQLRAFVHLLTRRPPGRSSGSSSRRRSATPR